LGKKEIREIWAKEVDSSSNFLIQKEWRLTPFLKMIGFCFKASRALLSRSLNNYQYIHKRQYTMGRLEGKVVLV
jgi:hypothetical protein